MQGVIMLTNLEDQMLFIRLHNVSYPPSFCIFTGSGMDLELSPLSRWLTVAYLLVGVPIMFVYLKTTGGLAARGIRLLTRHIVSCHKKQKDGSSSDKARNKVWSIICPRTVDKIFVCLLSRIITRKNYFLSMSAELLDLFYIDAQEIGSKIKTCWTNEN